MLLALLWELVDLVVAVIPGARVMSGLLRFPIDIRTVEKKLGLEPSYTTYAAYPECSCLHSGVPYGGNSNVITFSSACTFQGFPDEPKCSAPLTKPGVYKDESINVPKRLYHMQDYESFLASFLSQPGMIDILWDGMNCHKKEVMCDIRDGSLLSNLKDGKGLKFMDHQSKELCLAWSMSTDSFNPNRKVGGKHFSAGMIAFTCLNLPPHLRHHPENTFLAAIIPGRHELSIDQINHFLKPIVDQFLRAYKHSSWIVNADLHAEGFLARSAIAALVSNLPAAKRTAGFLSHSANVFCSVCTLTKVEINAVEIPEERLRTRDDHMEKVREWLNKQLKHDCDEHARTHGVHWSELLRLPYWNPLDQVVVDGMHMFFLGNVMTHLHGVLGIDSDSNRGKNHGEREIFVSEDFPYTPPPSTYTKHGEDASTASTSRQDLIAVCTCNAGASSHEPLNDAVTTEISLAGGSTNASTSNTSISAMDPPQRVLKLCVSFLTTDEVCEI
jgi:hypothetical protein